MSFLLKLPLSHQGKVRNTYLLPGFPDLLLMVASDRMSTFNVVHATEFLGKGYYLTAQSVHMMTGPLYSSATHLVAAGTAIRRYLPHGDFPADLIHRAVVVRKCSMLPFEFIWRQHLEGSLFRAYAATGTNPYGIHLPPNLPRMHRFESAIFTPTKKSEHDEPVPASSVVDAFPLAVDLTRRAFEYGSRALAGSGITVIDSKFEVGICESGTYRGSLVLADEALTSDSSRFAMSEDVRVGEEPPFADKEPARIISLRKWGSGRRDPLEFGTDEVTFVMDGYRKVFERITGKTLADFQQTSLEYDEAA